MSAWGVCSGGGGSAPEGRGVTSQHALRQTPPVNRMTNRCKNITLAITSFRPVMKSFLAKQKPYFKEDVIKSTVPHRKKLTAVLTFL